MRLPGETHESRETAPPSGGRPELHLIKLFYMMYRRDKKIYIFKIKKLKPFFMKH